MKRNHRWKLRITIGIFLAFLPALMMTSWLMAGEGGTHIELAWENIHLGMTKAEFQKKMGSIQVEYVPLHGTDLLNFAYLEKPLDELVNENFFRCQILEDFQVKKCTASEFYVNDSALSINKCFQTVLKQIEVVRLEPSLTLIPSFGIPMEEWTEAVCYFFNDRLFAVRLTLKEDRYLNDLHSNFPNYTLPEFTPNLGFVGLKDEHIFVIGTSMDLSNATCQAFFYNRDQYKAFTQYLTSCKDLLYQFLDN